jgi:hypothetical protein
MRGLEDDFSYTKESGLTGKEGRVEFLVEGI